MKIETINYEDDDDLFLYIVTGEAEELFKFSQEVYRDFGDDADLVGETDCEYTYRIEGKRTAMLFKLKYC